MSIDAILETVPANRREYLRRQIAAMIQADLIYHNQIASAYGERPVSLKAIREFRRNGYAGLPPHLHPTTNPR